MLKIINFYESGVYIMLNVFIIEKKLLNKLI